MIISWPAQVDKIWNKPGPDCWQRNLYKGVEIDGYILV
jgi:hypothetical protein